MLLTIINFLGIISFSISGMLKGKKHKLDLLGIVVLGTITSVGGGITRDILLNKVPTTLINPNDAYLAIFVSIFSYILLHDRVEGNRKTARFVRIADAAGLALFTVVGAEKGVEMELGAFGTVLMGTLTGVGGGVIRDMLVREIPFILKEDLYAILCIVGSLIYWIGRNIFDIHSNFLIYGIILGIFVIRMFIIKYKLKLPNEPLPFQRREK